MAKIMQDMPGGGGGGGKSKNYLYQQKDEYKSFYFSPKIYIQCLKHILMYANANLKSTI